MRSAAGSFANHSDVTRRHLGSPPKSSKRILGLGSVRWRMVVKMPSLMMHAIRLLAAGIDNIVILERGSEVGDTWRSEVRRGD